MATFRLGCSDPAEAKLKLHAETGEGQYLAVTQSNLKPDFKSVSFVEDLNKSKSRWIELRVYDDETYQKLLKARQDGSSESYYQPMKTLSVSHHGVSGGPFIKMETIATLALIGAFFYAHTLRSKIVG